MLQGVVFDLDGTLVDSEVVWDRALQLLAARFGKTYDLAWKGELMGKPAIEATKVLMHQLDLTGDPAEVLVLRDTCYAEASGGLDAAPKEGADALLRSLNASQIPLALATGANRSYALRVLAAYGWSDLFQAVVTSDDVSFGKPAPDMYEEAVRRLGCANHRCVAFEDSPLGVESARGAKLIVVGIHDGRSEHNLSHADIVISSLSEMDVERIRTLVADERD